MVYVGLNGLLHFGYKTIKYQSHSIKSINIVAKSNDLASHKDSRSKTKKNPNNNVKKA